MLHFGTPTFYTAFKLLERIANGEMIAHPILETGEVVVAALTRLVGQMQADTHIETDHKKVHVISKTKAGYNTHSIQFSGVTIACSRTS